MPYKCILFLYLSLLCLSTESCFPSEDSTTHHIQYKEQYRNQIHFSPPANWMNDPNGMVYYEGEYHLFYQYYPDSTVWGPMHWGHAASKDLIHWDHLPIALYPDSLGYIFSGSAVIDKENTAGFGRDAMIAIFTHHDIEGERAKTNTFQYQSIAYSTDKGRTFTKYEGNPVIQNPGIKDFRDPKVIWDEENNQWVMVFAAYDRALFYVSQNLKDWKKVSEFGIEGDDRLWECPDLFPIKVKNSIETKWVLITSIQKKAPNGGTATSYFVGDWDGSNFIADNTNQKWLDYGTDNYAGVTWSNAPTSHDEKLYIGWMSNWQYAQVVPSETWRSAMTLPRTLSLYKIDDAYHICSKPIDISSLHRNGEKAIPQQKNEKHIPISNPALLKLNIQNANTSNLKLKLSNDMDEHIIILYDHTSSTMSIDRTRSGNTSFQEQFAGVHTAPRKLKDDSMDMEIYVDHAAVEIYIDGGLTSMTDICFPSQPYNKLTIMEGLATGTSIPLHTIW